MPGGSVSKESACNAGDSVSIPGSGRSPGKRNGNPLQTEEPGGLQSIGSQSPTRLSDYTTTPGKVTFSCFFFCPRPGLSVTSNSSLSSSPGAPLPRQLWTLPVSPVSEGPAFLPKPWAKVSRRVDRSPGPGKSPDAPTETPEPDLEPEVRSRAQRVPEPGPVGSPRRAWCALRMFPPQAAPAQELRRHEAGLGEPGRPALRARCCGWALSSSRTGAGPVGEPKKARSLRAIAALRAGDLSATFDRRRTFNLLFHRIEDSS